MRKARMHAPFRRATPLGATCGLDCAPLAESYNMGGSIRQLPRSYIHEVLRRVL